MKHRNLILLAVLLLLVGLFFILQKREPKEKILRIMPADSTLVASIEVSNAADTVIVAKVGEGWMMQYPDQYKANPDMINYFFEAVFNATYSGMPISESGDDPQRYGLAKDKALQIKVLDKSGKVLAHCLFGNPNTAYDYFRFDKDKRIYQVKQAIYGRLQPNPESWRSPNILSLKWDEMSSITVEHSKNSYVLTRQDSYWYYMDKREKFVIPDNNSAMSKILNVLKSLEAWVYRKPQEMKDKKTEWVADVVIGMTDKSTHKLKFVKDKDEYLMSVDGDESRWYVVIFDQVSRFTRHAAVFQQKQWQDD